MTTRARITDCGCPNERGYGHRDGCPTLRALNWPDGTPKIAPVQGFVAGIPWSLQLEAYDAYSKKWCSQTALIDLDRRGCRGGFGTEELDGFVPGWRDKVGEIAALRARIAELTEALHLADATLSGANMNRAVVERKIRAALSQGTGKE